MAVLDDQLDGTRQLGACCRLDACVTASQRADAGGVRVCWDRERGRANAVGASASAVDSKRLEKFIDTGSILLTPETIYLPENQKIVFPFTDTPALK